MAKTEIRLFYRLLNFGETTLFQRNAPLANQGMFLAEKSSTLKKAELASS
jgi:hypothetical protein